MLAILSKLVPFRDYVYAALAIAAVTFYNVHVHDLEVAYGAKQKAAVEQAYAAASAQALSAAKKVADAKEAQYTIQLSQVEENYETALKSADAQHAADLARVRQLTAQGNSDANAVLHSTDGTGTGSDGGPSRAAALGAAVDLADALRRDDAQLTQCWHDRDALTGK